MTRKGGSDYGYYENEEPGTPDPQTDERLQFREYPPDHEVRHDLIEQAALGIKISEKHPRAGEDFWRLMKYDTSQTPSWLDTSPETGWEKDPKLGNQATRILMDCIQHQDPNLLNANVIANEIVQDIDLRIDRLEEDTRTTMRWFDPESHQGLSRIIISRARLNAEYLEYSRSEEMNDDAKGDPANSRWAEGLNQYLWESAQNLRRTQAALISGELDDASPDPFERYQGEGDFQDQTMERNILLENAFLQHQVDRNGWDPSVLEEQDDEDVLEELGAYRSPFTQEMLDNPEFLGQFQDFIQLHKNPGSTEQFTQRDIQGLAENISAGADSSRIIQAHGGPTSQEDITANTQRLVQAAQ